MWSPLLPELVVHADWSKDAGKRWAARAVLGGDGRFTAHAPEPVGEAGSYVARMAAEAGPGGCALLGFDFPIGLPVAYARRAGIASFRDLLPKLGAGDWAAFYDVAERPDEIGPHRPFYPFRSGGTRQRYLTAALGVDDMDALFRRCERRSADQPAASSLFWTLGGKQVGRAAIAGWRDMLVPALANPDLDVALWPFDGELGDLVRRHRVVVAETYPAVVYPWLGIDLRRGGVGRNHGKRWHGSRTSNAGPLLTWLANRGVRAIDDLTICIDEGFSAGEAGEDPFDAVVGLFGMLEVVLGRRPEGAPPDPDVRAVEGWILGAVRKRN